MQRIKVSPLEQGLRLNGGARNPQQQRGRLEELPITSRSLTRSFAEREKTSFPRDNPHARRCPRDPAGISALEYEVHHHTIR